MKGTANLQVNDEHVIEVRLQMTAREAKDLRAQLRTVERWPSWSLVRVLDDTLGALQQHFEAEHKSEP